MALLYAGLKMRVRAILVSDSGSIALGRGFDSEEFILPGGHAEEGEHSVDAILRELAEETGIIGPFDIEFIGKYCDQEIFLVMTQGEPVLSSMLDPDKEFVELQWFTPDNLPVLEEHSADVVYQFLKGKSLDIQEPSDVKIDSDDNTISISAPGIEAELDLNTKIVDLKKLDNYWYLGWMEKIAEEYGMEQIITPDIPDHDLYADVINGYGVFTHEVTSILKKCRSCDAKPGRPWCIYKHNEKDSFKIASPQPKGWPKTYETKEDAKNGLKMMHVFGETNESDEHKKTSYLFWPVLLNGEEYHITTKFFGESQVTLDDICELLSGYDNKLGFVPEFTPTSLHTKEGEVKVLEIKNAPNRIYEMHDMLGILHKDTYPTYRPHITVPEELWQKVKDENLSAMQLNFKVAGLRFRKGDDPIQKLPNKITAGKIDVLVDKEKVGELDDDTIYQTLPGLAQEQFKGKKVEFEPQEPDHDVESHTSIAFLNELNELFAKSMRKGSVQKLILSDTFYKGDEAGITDQDTTENRDEKILEYSFGVLYPRWMNKLERSGGVEAGSVVLYRGISADKHEVDFKKLGVYWTWDVLKADNYSGKNTGKSVLIIKAQVPFSAIDFDSTLRKLVWTGYGDTESEHEFELKPGKTIKILEIINGPGIAKPKVAKSAMEIATKDELEKITSELMQKYFPGLPVPNVSLAEDLEDEAKTIWNAENKTCDIMLHERFYKDLKLCRQMIAHELIHHAMFITKGGDISEEELHGEDFNKLCEVINAGETPGYVAPYTEQTMIKKSEPEPEEADNATISTSSIMDFKTKILNPAVFDGMKMKPEARELITKEARNLCDILALTLKHVLLYGGSASYTWHPGTDIDCSIYAEIPGGTSDAQIEIWQGQVKDYKKEVDSGDMKFELHFYLKGVEEGKELTEASDAVYSVTDDKWIKEPETPPENPLTAYDVALVEADKFASKIGQKIDLLERIDTMITYFEKQKPYADDEEAIEEAESILRSAKEELVAKLTGIFEKLHEERGKAHQEVRKEGVSRASQIEITWKYLDMVGYLDELYKIAN